MNRKDMMKLKPGDIVAVMYDDEPLPVVEVVKQSATKAEQYIEFESNIEGCCGFWNIDDALQINKIGYVKRTFEFN